MYIQHCMCIHIHTHGQEPFTHTQNYNENMIGYDTLTAYMTHTCIWVLTNFLNLNCQYITEKSQLLGDITCDLSPLHNYINN
jgi:hypothetical protein